MKVIVAPGNLTYNDFKEIIVGLDDIEIVGVLLKGWKKFPDWHPDKTGLKTWTYEQLIDTKIYCERTPLHDYYDRIISVLLGDSRTFFLLERLFSNKGLSSIFNNVIKVEQLVWNSLSILNYTQAERLVTMNTPHSTLWFIARVFELIGIDVYMTATSPLPWKTWVVRGMDDHKPILRDELDGMNDRLPNQEIKNYVEKIRLSYQVAMPDYEKRRFERYNGKFFDLKVEISTILTSKSLKSLLYNIYSSNQKYKSYKTISKLSENFILPQNYVVFFPHFQPERTTLPEGLKYVQQFLAIRALHESLPETWHLVVKEHPSTFRNTYDPQVRNIDFYNAITTLPNAHLAPLDFSPFDLIDKSLAVSTITGTVGLEAVIRGKPVLVFGVAQYRKLKGVFSVQSIDECSKVLQQIKEISVIPTDEELYRYLQWVDANSFAKEKRINSSIGAFRYAFEILENNS